MPFCPECKYEYVAGITKCPDCRVELVDKLAGESPEAVPVYDENVELVCVAQFINAVDAEMAKVRLDLGEIKSVLFDEVVSRAYAAPVFMQGGVRLMVNKDDAQRAIEILEAEEPILEG